MLHKGDTRTWHTVHHHQELDAFLDEAFMDAAFADELEEKLVKFK